MRIKFIEKIKRMIEYANKSEKPEQPIKDNENESSLLSNVVAKFDKEKLKKEYEHILTNMESNPVDMYDPNVQRIYSQACNFLALQSFRMSVASSCDEDPILIDEMSNKVLRMFFSSVRSTLFRKLEVNELIHDNKFSKDNIGDELIDRFNKCNNDKISKSIGLAEKLIKQSLRLTDEDDAKAEI